MTKKQIAYKKALLRRIHTAPLYKQLFSQDRALWEEFLQRNFKVKSSKELDIASLVRLAEYLEGKADSPTLPASAQQIDYILYLWQERATFKDIFSLLKLAKRVLKRDVKDIYSITKKEASALIAAIKNIRRRKPANNADYTPNTHAS